MISKSSKVIMSKDFSIKPNSLIDSQETYWTNTLEYKVIIKNVPNPTHNGSFHTVAIDLTYCDGGHVWVHKSNIES